MIKIAFIMLCHKNPNQINYLNKKLLKYPQSDIYIHVDLDNSQLRKKIRINDRIYMLQESESYHIEWGGINIVRATLQLIHTVKNSGKNYDYIWLVSGQDFPIVPLQEIEKRLSANSEMNYIDVILPRHKRYNWYKKLCEVPYPQWINRDIVPVKAYKRLYKIFTGGYSHTFPLFIREKPFDFELAFGSQWWTLTCEAAYEILEYSDNHSEILDYFSKAMIPDECFFQTLFMHGSFSKDRSRSLTYVYMGRNTRHPEIITDRHLIRISKIKNDFCFARKFDSRSQKLIQLL